MQREELQRNVSCFWVKLIYVEYICSSILNGLHTSRACGLLPVIYTSVKLQSRLDVINCLCGHGGSGVVSLLLLFPRGPHPGSASTAVRF